MGVENEMKMEMEVARGLWWEEVGKGISGNDRLLSPEVIKGNQR